MAKRIIRFKGRKSVSLEPETKSKTACTHSDEKITTKLKKTLFNNGADLVGIADLTGHVPYDLKKFNRGISIAIKLADNIINEAIHGPTKEYAQLYVDVNSKLDKLASFSSDILQKEGFSTIHIPASKIENTKKFLGKYPHKTVATLSGLGWIGRSALFISNKYGPRIRLVSVLTDAPLKPDAFSLRNKCNSCKACVINCPGKAIKGNKWVFKEEREKIFDAAACNSILVANKKLFGVKVCGICVAICPYR